MPSVKTFLTIVAVSALTFILIGRYGKQLPVVGGLF